MSGALFLVGAIALSIVGSVALWLRSRPPTSFESGIDDFARALGADARLKGFILNKAYHTLSDDRFADAVVRLYGGQRLGTIPADLAAIKAYQDKQIALRAAPASDFALYVSRMISELVAADLRHLESYSACWDCCCLPTS